MKFNKEFVGNPNLFFNITDERAYELEKKGLSIVNALVKTDEATNKDVLLAVTDLAETDDEKVYLAFAAGAILEQLGAFN